MRPRRQALSPTEESSACDFFLWCVQVSSRVRCATRPLLSARLLDGGGFVLLAGGVVRLRRIEGVGGRVLLAAEATREEAGDRGASLLLVPHVDADREQQHEA